MNGCSRQYRKEFSVSSAHWLAHSLDIIQMSIKPPFLVYTIRDLGFNLMEAWSFDPLKQVGICLGGIVECSNNADLVFAKPFYLQPSRSPSVPNMLCTNTSQ